MSKYYSAYPNGGSVVVTAPKYALGIQYLRDKVSGDTITYTPFSLLDGDLLKTAPIDNMITGMKSGGSVVLSVWKECAGEKFERNESETGIITYDRVEVNK